MRSIKIDRETVNTMMQACVQHRQHLLE